MKAIKRELRRIKYFYQFQDVEVRIFLLLITTIGLIGLVAMVVNFIYYGI